MAGETLGYDVFDSGPPMRLERILGLRSPGRPSTALRLAVVLTVAWVPLVAFTVVQTLLGPGPGLVSFLSDCGVNVRVFLAIPALVLAESDCLPWLHRIVRQFIDAGVVPGADAARFQLALSSTRRLLDSWIAEVAVLAVAFAISIGLIFLVPRHILPAWYHGVEGAPMALSLAGWWHSLVTLPLLLVLFLGWLWRMAMWARFLWRVSRLDLQLIPGHPDHSGGLRFVSLCLQRFRLIGFAMGAVLAGAVANRVVFEGARVRDFEPQIVALVCVVLAVFVLPLTVFMEKLRDTRRRGICEYGALAASLGQQFEHKWLRPGTVDAKSMTVPDFSATTDLYSIVSNVYAMRDVPFRLKDLIGPIVGALVPFIPIILFVLPLQTLLADLADLLL